MGNGRDSDPDLMKALDEINATGDADTLVGISERQKMLIQVLFFKVLRPMFKTLAFIRSCLPVQPWMARAVGAISVLGAAGLIWAASALVSDIKADIRTSQKDATTAQTQCSEELATEDLKIQPPAHSDFPERFRES